MIFHSEHKSGFVMIDRAAVDDSKISFRAKGILHYLLSKPQDWRPTIADIQAHGTEGRDAIEAAIKELKEAGYAQTVTEAGSNGRFSDRRIVVSENPIKSRVSTLTLKNRNRVFQGITKNEGTKKGYPERVRLEFEEMRHWPPKSSAFPFDKEVWRQEALKVIGILGLEEGSRYWQEWMARIDSAPVRTRVALEYLEEELIDKVPIRNPSGRANWYFKNLDLDHKGGTRLKESSRGKPLRKW